MLMEKDKGLFDIYFRKTRPGEGKAGKIQGKKEKNEMTESEKL